MPPLLLRHAASAYGELPNMVSAVEAVNEMTQLQLGPDTKEENRAVRKAFHHDTDLVSESHVKERVRPRGLRCIRSSVSC